MSRNEHVRSRVAGFWKGFKRSARSYATPIIGSTALALVIASLVVTIPSNLSTDLTLAMLTALLTSGTVLFPLAGVVLTFTLNSAKTRMESLDRGRLAVWIAQQEAIVKARTENKPEIITEIESRFGSIIEECDAKIAAVETEVRPLTWVGISVFALMLAQILVSLRTMAEVSPQQPFPHVWVWFSISLLVVALYGLAILVYWTAQIGRSTESR